MEELINEIQKRYKQAQSKCHDNVIWREEVDPDDVNYDLGRRDALLGLVDWISKNCKV